MSLPISGSGSPIQNPADINAPQQANSTGDIQTQINTILAVIPFMKNDVDDLIENLQSEMGNLMNQLHQATEAGDEEKVQNLTDVALKTNQELKDKMDESAMLQSVADRLTNTDPTDDVAALNDFYAYQQQQQAEQELNG